MNFFVDMFFKFLNIIELKFKALDVQKEKFIDLFFSFTAFLFQFFVFHAFYFFLYLRKVRLTDGGKIKQSKIVFCLCRVHAFFKNMLYRILSTP